MSDVLHLIGLQDVLKGLKDLVNKTSIQGVHTTLPQYLTDDELLSTFCGEARFTTSFFQGIDWFDC